MANPTRKGSSSNHPFSGAKMLVSGSVYKKEVFLRMHTFEHFWAIWVFGTPLIFTQLIQSIERNLCVFVCWKEPLGSLNLKGSRLNHPNKVTSRIARYPYTLLVLTFDPPTCWGSLPLQGRWPCVSASCQPTWPPLQGVFVGCLTSGVWEKNGKRAILLYVTNQRADAKWTRFKTLMIFHYTGWWIGILI